MQAIASTPADKPRLTKETFFIFTTPSAEKARHGVTRAGKDRRGLSATHTQQRLRGEKALGTGLGNSILLALHITQGTVVYPVAGAMIVEEARAVVHRGRDVRSHERCAHRRSPEVTLGIPAIQDCSAPVILVVVELALGYCMSASLFESRFHFPYPVQFPAHVLRIHVVLPHYGLVAVSQKRVVVVRDDHFPLTQQLPVVTLGRAATTEGFVNEVHAGGNHVGSIEVDTRRLANPALPSKVLPKCTTSVMIQNVMNHQCLASTECRFIGQLNSQHILGFRRGFVGFILVVERILANVLCSCREVPRTTGRRGPYLVIRFRCHAPPK